jgi:nucleotide-binding universal stress UspA family protein
VIKSIVLAIDGSVHAKNAQAVAIDLASKYGARLTLVHVLTDEHPSKEFSRMAEVEHLSDSKKPRVSDKENTYSSVARFLGSASESKEARVIVLLGEQIIDNASASASKAGVANVTAEIHTGDYANNILKVAKKADADMIVMGRRGLSNLKGFVTGSVSHKVSQRSECSVLTVK